MRIHNQFYGPSETGTFEETPDGFLRVHARVLKEGIAPYGRDELQEIPDSITDDPIMILIPLDAMKAGECMRSLEGSLVTAFKHNWITPQNAKDGKGHAAGAALINGPYQEIDYLITDPETIEAIKKREIGEISSAYHADVVWSPGEWNGQKYQGQQSNIFHNHSAIIEAKAGRIGSDVKITNQKKEGATNMADQTLVRVKLPRTGKFLNVDEEGARNIEEEQKKGEVDGEAKDKSVEEKMKEHESLKAEFDAMKKELEESKGELAVIKKQLEELLKDETVEKKAGEMNEEQGEADEIVENCELKNEAGEELDEKKKDEFKNSYRKLHGTKLHDVVLKVAGIKIENMSADAKRGAFKALVAISVKAGGTKVAGTKLMIQNRGGEGNQQGSRESSLKMLGY